MISIARLSRLSLAPTWHTDSTQQFPSLLNRFGRYACDISLSVRLDSRLPSAVQWFATIGLSLPIRLRPPLPLFLLTWP